MTHFHGKLGGLYLNFTVLIVNSLSSRRIYDILCKIIFATKTSRQVERFRVQRSGLKNPQTAHIKGIEFSSYFKNRFTPRAKSVIPDLAYYSKRFPTGVTFEPRTSEL